MERVEEEVRVGVEGRKRNRFGKLEEIERVKKQMNVV